MQHFRMILTDAAMDACILMAVQLSLGRLNFRRLLAALPVMQLPTCIYLMFGDAARHPLLLATAALAAAYIIVPYRRFIHLIHTLCCVLSASFAAAGMVEALGRRRWFLSAASGLIILTAVLRKRVNICYRWNIEVMAECNGQSLCFDALIDTGNRLHEPISGLPVLIITDKLAQPGFYKDKALRSLAFGVLGSSGEIQAFRPDAVYIRQNAAYAKAPECYVAIFPGRLPGRVQALAPPDFTEVLEPLSPTFRRCFNRRNDHAVF